MSNLHYIKVLDVAATASCGTLKETTLDAINLAKELGCTVTFKFNGIEITVDEWDDVDVAGFRYEREAKNRL